VNAHGPGCAPGCFSDHTDEAREAQATAWTRGYLFGYYLDRGHTEDEAHRRSAGPIPSHLNYPPWLDGENPFTDTERSDWDAD
jgi:hypothetical protein